jgi:hypothetical protein
VDLAFLRVRAGKPFSGADRFALALGVLCLLAGVLLLALDSGFVVSVVGAGLVGLAGVVFVALVFLLVGESEDRDYGRRAR